jgi:hypothetical protein
MDTELDIRSYTNASPQLRIDHNSWNQTQVIQFENPETAERRRRVLNALFKRFYSDEIDGFRHLYRSPPRSQLGAAGISHVPLRIALSSGAAISAYLYGGGYTVEQISNRMDVSETTVEQYISDFLQDRR